MKEYEVNNMKQNVNPNTIPNANPNMNPNMNPNVNSNINPNSDDEEDVTNTDPELNIPIRERAGRSTWINGKQSRAYAMQEDADRLSYIFSRLRKPGPRLAFLLNLKTYSNVSGSVDPMGRIPQHELERMIRLYRIRIATVASPEEYRQFLISVARLEARIKRGIYREYQQQLANIPKSDPHREQKAMWLAQNGLYGEELKALNQITRGTEVMMSRVEAEPYVDYKLNNTTTVAEYAARLGLSGKDLDEFCAKNGYSPDDTIADIALRYNQFDEDSVYRSMQKEVKQFEHQKTYQQLVNYFLIYKTAMAEQEAVRDFVDNKLGIDDMFHDIVDWIRGAGNDMRQREMKHRIGDFMDGIERRYKFGHHGRLENLTPEQRKYEEFIMKRLGGPKRFDESVMRENFVLVLAAYSLGKMNVPFSEKQIRKTAANISRVYSLDNLHFDSWNTAMKSRASVLSHGAGIRKELYSVKNQGMDSYVKEMKFLRNTMRPGKEQSAEYNRMVANVSRVVEIGESKNMSPARKEVALRRANMALMDSVEKYAESVTKAKKNTPKNENLNQALDVLSVISRFTNGRQRKSAAPGQGGAESPIRINRRVADILRLVNGVRDPRIMIDIGTFERSFGASRIIGAAANLGKAAPEKAADAGKKANAGKNAETAKAAGKTVGKAVGKIVPKTVVVRSPGR